MFKCLFNHELLSTVIIQIKHRITCLICSVFLLSKVIGGVQAAQFFPLFVPPEVTLPHHAMNCTVPVWAIWVNVCQRQHTRWATNWKGVPLKGQHLKYVLLEVWKILILACFDLLVST